MRTFRNALAALLVLVAAPLAAETLRFEGTYTHFESCPRLACDDVLEPITPLPFSFDVQLAFNPNGSIHQSLSTTDPSRWPGIAFPLAIEQALRLVPSDEPRSGTYFFNQSQATEHTTGGFNWRFSARESWDERIGADAEGPLFRGETRILMVDLFRPGGVTFEQASRPLTFNEMIGFLRGLVGSPAAFSTRNLLSFYRLDGTADRGAFQLSGDFRLVSITPSQCAAPTGLRRLFG